MNPTFHRAAYSIRDLLNHSENYGDMLLSFDHLLCSARCCSMPLDAARCCSMLLDAARCCSMLLCSVWWQSKILGEQSNMPFPLGVVVHCAVRCWIRLTTLSSLIDSRMLSSYCLHLHWRQSFEFYRAQRRSSWKSKNVRWNLVFVWPPRAEQHRLRQSRDEQMLCAARWNVGFVWPGP